VDFLAQRAVDQIGFFVANKRGERDSFEEYLDTAKAEAVEFRTLTASLYIWLRR
jgi:hypothetical protein